MNANHTDIEVERVVRQVLADFPGAAHQQLLEQLFRGSQESVLNQLFDHRPERMVPFKIDPPPALNWPTSASESWGIDVAEFLNRTWLLDQCDQPWFKARLCLIDQKANQFRDLVHDVVVERLGTPRYSLAAYGSFVSRESRSRDLDLICVHSGDTSLQIFGSQEIEVQGLKSVFPWMADELLDLNVISINALTNTASETAMQMRAALSGAVYLIGSPPLIPPYLRLMHVIMMWGRQSWVLLREPKAPVPLKMKSRAREVRGILTKIILETGVQLNRLDQLRLESGVAFDSHDDETVASFFPRMSDIIGNYVESIDAAIKHEVANRLRRTFAATPPRPRAELVHSPFHVSYVMPAQHQVCGISKYSSALLSGLRAVLADSVTAVEVAEAESTLDEGHLFKQLKAAVHDHGSYDAPRVLHVHFADGLLRKNNSEAFVEFQDRHAGILRQADVAVATIYELGPRMVNANRLPLGATTPQLRQRILRQLRKEMTRLLNSVDGVIVHSTEQLRHLSEDPEFSEIVASRSIQVEVMRHGIPRPARFYLDTAARAQVRSTVRSSYSIPDDHTVLIQFGFIRPNKYGFDILTLLKEHKSLVWLLAGGPRQPSHASYRDKILQNAREMGLTSRVVVTGTLPDDDISRVFAAADIAIVPYQHGSESYALASAIGHRLPCVTSPLPFVSELRRRYGDVVYRAGTEEEFAAAIEFLAHSDEYRHELGEKAALAAELDSWEEVARRTVGFYQRVLLTRRN